MRKFNITVNGVSYEVEVEEVTESTSPGVDSEPTAGEQTPAAKSASPAASEGAAIIEAPMPGNIWKVEVKEGQGVKAGDVLVILEAMKMENEILAPVDGIVASVHVAEGASVSGGDVLVSLKQ